MQSVAVQMLGGGGFTPGAVCLGQSAQLLLLRVEEGFEKSRGVFGDS